MKMQECIFSLRCENSNAEIHFKGCESNNFKTVCSPSPCCQDHFEPHKVWEAQFPRTLIFTSKCFKENLFTNPGMYLLWISGFDISHMWMSPWLNSLKSASSALHIMYYSSLFAKWSLYRLYIIHFVPQPRQGQVYLDSSSTATNINMYY